MRRIAVHCVIATVALIALACSHPGDAARVVGREALLGHWKWDAHATEWGPAEMDVTFAESGVVEVMAVFTEEEPATRQLVARERFEVRQGCIVSPAFFKGKPAKVSFSDGALFITYGDEVSGPFRRVQRN